MITNLEHVEHEKPFWRFSVLMEYIGVLWPVNGFIYREGEGVTVPYMKWGKQGTEGKRTYLVGGSVEENHLVERIAAEVEEVIGPPEIRETKEAARHYAMDKEACRKLYPSYYRACVLKSLGDTEMFEDLPVGRLWPDQVLKKWVELAKRGLRDPYEFRRDVVNGVTNTADYERIKDLVKEIAD
jgi:hypothetical protein